jgi:hypothetical protein
MTHQLLPSASMPCGRCRHWTDGVHVLSETPGASLSVEYVCAHCCDLCRPAAPLPEREVETLQATQEDLF